MLKIWKAPLLTLAFIITFAVGWMARAGWERNVFPSFNQAAEKFFFGGARLASDDKEYLGQVVGECYEGGSKKPTSYKIERADGSIIERKADSIRIYSP